MVRTRPVVSIYFLDQIHPLQTIGNTFSYAPYPCYPSIYQKPCQTALKSAFVSQGKKLKQSRDWSVAEVSVTVFLLQPFGNCNGAMQNISLFINVQNIYHSPRRKRPDEFPRCIALQARAVIRSATEEKNRDATEYNKCGASEGNKCGSTEGDKRGAMGGYKERCDGRKTSWRYGRSQARPHLV